MTKAPRILVIEDQPEVLGIIVHLLKRAGCQVTTAQNGRDGLRQAQSGGFDLITLDIDLCGDLDGHEVCRQLKQNDRLNAVPVVFVSGRLYEEDRVRAFEVGAVDYITKPFDVLAFAARILSHVRQEETVEAGHG